MKLTIDRGKLLPAINQVKNAVNTKSHIQIYSGILFDANENGLILIGTDGILAIELTVPVEEFRLERTGSIVIPAKTASEIVEKLLDGEITIESNGLMTKFKCGRASLEVSGMDAEDYTRPNASGDSVVMIGAGTLRRLIRKSTFCVSDKKTESRPILYGVNVQVDGERIDFIAGDGSRIATVNELAECAHPFSAVVTGKHLDRIKDLFNEKEEVALSLSSNRATFRGERITAHVGIIDHPYPPIDSVFAGETHYQASIKTRDLIESIERARITADNDTVTLNLFKNRIVIRSHGELGQTAEEIEPFKGEGEELERSYNGEKLIDALKAIDGDWTRIRFTSHPGCPIIISDPGDELDVEIPVSA